MRALPELGSRKNEPRPSPNNNTGSLTQMTRAVTFTQAQVRRAVKAAESAGLRVRSVTVRPDGSIVVENGPVAVDSPRLTLPASWDDA
jgi:hypothetical protein